MRASWPLALAPGRLLLGSPAPAAQSGAETREYRYLMGTSMQVQAIGGDEAARRAAIDEAFAAMTEVDRLMSNYRSDSELSHVNREAARGPVVVSDPLLRVIEAAQRVSADSDGAFDMTVGPLVQLWGFRDRTPHIPTSAELAAVRPLVGYRSLIVDAPHHTVRFAHPGMEIDLGGIAKGFAVEVAANVLRAAASRDSSMRAAISTCWARRRANRSGRSGSRIPTSPTVDRRHRRDGRIGVDVGGLREFSRRRRAHVRTPARSPHAPAVDGVAERDHRLGRRYLADAMSKAAFILGPQQGIALIDATPGMAGVIAYRKPDGSVGVAVSQRAAWRRVR